MENDKNLRRRLQFEIYKGQVVDTGKFEKTRLVGIGFLREGKHEYKLKIFSDLTSKFYVRPNENVPGQYVVLSKDEVTRRGKVKKVYWSEVGEAQLLSAIGLLEIKIDLRAEPIYMSIFPKKFEDKKYQPVAKLGELKLVS